jgi:hypothetical protein
MAAIGRETTAWRPTRNASQPNDDPPHRSRLADANDRPHAVHGTIQQRNIAMIARLAILATAAALVAGCTPPPATTAAASATSTAATPTAATTIPAAMATIASFTQADLTAAINMAQAATPPDTEAVTCFSYISGNLTTLQGQVGGATAPVGVFSGFEAANLALGVANGGMSTASKTALEIACGPLAAHVVNTGESMVSEVTTLLGQVGIHVAMP